MISHYWIFEWYVIRFLFLNHHTFLCLVLATWAIQLRIWASIPVPGQWRRMIAGTVRQPRAQSRPRFRRVCKRKWPIVARQIWFESWLMVSTYLIVNSLFYKVVVCCFFFSFRLILVKFVRNALANVFSVHFYFWLTHE